MHSYTHTHIYIYISELGFPKALKVSVSEMLFNKVNKKSKMCHCLTMKKQFQRVPFGKARDESTNKKKKRQLRVKTLKQNKSPDAQTQKKK